MNPYPRLESWLAHAKPANPWLPLLRGIVDDPGFCESMEPVLELLETVAPENLASLRKRFGDDDEGNVFALRTELLLGYHLARANVPFRFGGEGEPDLVCATSPVVSIEARMRSRDDVRKLLDELGGALREAHPTMPVEVTVHMDQRLTLSSADRAATIDRIFRQIGGSPPVTDVAVDLPDIGGSALISPSRWPQPTVHYGATSFDITRHLAEIEREIANCVAEKIEQSKRNGWDENAVVVVDVSHLGRAWNRPERMWRRQLEYLVPSWGPMPFAGVVILWTDFIATTMKGAGYFFDELSRGLQDSLDVVLGAIDMRVEWPNRLILP